MKFLTYYMISILSTLIIFNAVGLNTNSVLEVKKNEYNYLFNGFINSANNSPIVPSSMTMYELIEKYSEEHNIPKHIAYNIAFRETRYKGPFDWNYNPELISSAGAQGPMQVMPSTAKLIQGRVVSSEELRTNLELNIQTSMMLLERLYKKYGDWKIVCGCYNTGRPIVNEYAIYCSTKKDYISKWKFYE